MSIIFYFKGTQKKGIRKILIFESNCFVMLGLIPAAIGAVAGAAIRGSVKRRAKKMLKVNQTALKAGKDGMKVFSSKKNNKNGGDNSGGKTKVAGEVLKGVLSSTSK
jgi:hypothetical protein